MCWECRGTGWFVQDTQEAMDYFKKLREAGLSESERNSRYHDYQMEVARNCRRERNERLIKDADIQQHLDDPNRRESTRLPLNRRP